ncbi:sulfur reduction protein DsrE [Allofranklinella schreckenbergeri]|uniref:Sulfur reduction protein DsrE n=1 Tax=Allofranklinella schreckenbergeri TaxID=1076744 RepID=A0A3M6QI58_9BURK|nr:DsrE family protein [Allofranklinella schreckenbergeri]MDO4706608.1 DsrE family protein [Comamonadaceae bacterium]RRD43928.1 sulfur reduction protein DsrE [Comamonadaceae bacterium OH3737_COT-264]RMW99510.1 sulfur reduction protein DsrE [Allofranklinella schreckenbergeri]RMX02149.1 sulfur reduction protein DsrE [Allofranklinella schreckenbergeri]RMX10181.1 sulfur reduction protein DsrE [Allofranklinella schreckenbergeri]
MQTTDFVSTLFDGQSNPNKVTVAFTMALNAVQQGHSATLILMVEAVTLGKPGATQGMDIGQPFEPVSDLLEKFLAGGGRVVICRSCMVHNGLSEADMDPRFGFITAPEVVQLLMAAKGTLQVA